MATLGKRTVKALVYSGHQEEGEKEGETQKKVRVDLNLLLGRTSTLSLEDHVKMIARNCVEAYQQDKAFTYWQTSNDWISHPTAPKSQLCYKVWDELKTTNREYMLGCYKWFDEYLYTGEASMTNPTEQYSKYLKRKALIMLELTGVGLLWPVKVKDDHLVYKRGPASGLKMVIAMLKYVTLDEMRHYYQVELANPNGGYCGQTIKRNPTYRERAIFWMRHNVEEEYAEFVRNRKSEETRRDFESLADLQA